MDEDLLNRNFTGWKRLFIRFKGPMTVVSTGAPTLNRSLSGRELQVLHDLTRKLEPMYLGLVREEGGGTDLIPGVVVQLMLAHVENSYFSAPWWNSLTVDQKCHVRQLAQMGNPFYTPWTYMDKLPVPWHVTDIVESWPG